MEADRKDSGGPEASHVEDGGGDRAGPEASRVEDSGGDRVQGDVHNSKDIQPAAWKVVGNVKVANVEEPAVLDVVVGNNSRAQGQTA